MPTRVNVGCGPSPARGWLNIDNSPGVWIGRHPAPFAVLERTGLLSAERLRMARVAREAGIVWGNARRLPLADGSADAVYCSHVLEHLDCRQVEQFLSEVRRILAPGGVLRIAVPDLGLFVERYRQSEDADAFLESLRLAHEKPRLLSLPRVLLRLARGHAWMYDERSLTRLLREHGFTEATALPAGKTMMADTSGLDLREREDESLYVEARSPGPGFESRA
jgi:predicted SAM-dependent methyltransferase